MTMEGNVNMEPECREYCPQQFLWGETLDPISLIFHSLNHLVLSYKMMGRGILSCSEGAEKSSGKYGCNFASGTVQKCRIKASDITEENFRSYASDRSRMELYSKPFKVPCIPIIYCFGMNASCYSMFRS